MKRNIIYHSIAFIILACNNSSVDNQVNQSDSISVDTLTQIQSSYQSDDTTTIAAITDIKLGNLWPINPKIIYEYNTYKNLTDLLSKIDSNATIEIPSGIYTYPVRIYQKSHVKLYSQNPPAYFLIPNNGMNIFDIDSCRNITIENIYFRHDVPARSCSDASAVNIIYSSNIFIKHCYLNGCGTYGLSARYVSGLTLEYNIIEECMYSGTLIQYCSEVILNKNLIQAPLRNPHENATSSVYLIGGNNIFIKHCYLNGCGTYGLSAQYVSGLTLENNRINECMYNDTLIQKCLGVILDKNLIRVPSTKTSNYLEKDLTPMDSNWAWKPTSPFIHAPIEELHQYGLTYFSINNNTTQHFDKIELNKKKSIDIIYPGGYYHNSFWLQSLNNKTVYALSGDSIIKIKAHFNFFKMEEHLEPTKRYELTTDFKVDFILTGGALKTGKIRMGQINETGKDSYQIKLNDYQIEIKIINTDFFCALILQKNNINQVLLFKTTGLIGPYDERYRLVKPTWSGDLNSDDKPDFIVPYEFYCEFGEYLFLSSKNEKSGFEIIYMPDKKGAPCGC